MTEPDEELPSAEPVAVPDASEVDAAVASIKVVDSRWKDGKSRELADGKRWTPHLVRESPDLVLHVHLSDAVPGYVSRRLIAASADARVVVAVNFEALYDTDLLQLLACVDARLYVLNDPTGTLKLRHYLATLADLSIPVSPAVRRELAKEAWDRRKYGTDQEKGSRFEALLAFLLSQVGDFKVFQRNLRTATQEIDIVLQVDNFSKRCWSTPGVPFVHVEAKNWAETVGQPVVSLLIRKLETARGRARLGMVFTTSKFSEEARLEELRLSETELCVAMFDEASIVELMDAEDIESLLEEAIARAMLR